MDQRDDVRAVGRRVERLLDDLRTTGDPRVAEPLPGPWGGAVMTGASERIVVAGVGNIFLGDDGFGVEVVRQLAARPVPAGVQVVDIGIRGVHLAYDLLDGCRLLILVDTAARGEVPGTVSVLEVDQPAAPADRSATGGSARPALDPHAMAPDQVLALLKRLGSPPVRTLVVACEPADLTPGMDLSEPVRAAVPHAVRTVEAILADLTNPKGV